MAEQRENKCWSQSVGFYGSRVRVAERTPGGILYLLWVDKDGRQQKKSLGTRDKRLAKKKAHEVSAALASGAAEEPQERILVGSLVERFLREGLIGGTAKYRHEIEARLRFVAEQLGLDREVESLDHDDFKRFATARMEGRIRPAGSRGTGPVKPSTARHDFVALRLAINWAMRKKSGVGRLLRQDPMVGFRIPRAATGEVARPVASPGRFKELLRVAHLIHDYLPVLLRLAWGTGHRIGAIHRLRWQDVDFDAHSGAPNGRILWPGEFDKRGVAHDTPMSRRVAAALRAHREADKVGSQWIFPAAGDPSTHVERRLLNRWLRRAEKRAGLPHVRGGGWHMFRRAWATARKHFPINDVARAGGWFSTESLLECYQQSDGETLLDVIGEDDAEE
jgi:integrase